MCIKDQMTKDEAGKATRICRCACVRPEVVLAEIEGAKKKHSRDFDVTRNSDVLGWYE
jgi:hypothetical protein